MLLDSGHHRTHQLYNCITVLLKEVCFLQWQTGAVAWASAVCNINPAVKIIFWTADSGPAGSSSYEVNPLMFLREIEHVCLCLMRLIWHRSSFYFSTESHSFTVQTTVVLHFLFSRDNTVYYFRQYWMNLKGHIAWFALTTVGDSLCTLKLKVVLSCK